MLNHKIDFRLSESDYTFLKHISNEKKLSISSIIRLFIQEKYQRYLSEDYLL
ncbi:hypothetical protein NIES4075_72760 [Tolypothrix sp. NIES-4075]|nr:hypothetical protein NIES4075_72760 [Tolypothrix sp. NIES-4075]